MLSTVSLTISAHSHKTFGGEVDRTANADAQVHGYGKESEPEVEANAGVYLPALFNRFQPEEQQPAHDKEHADSDEELDEKEGGRDEIVVSLRNETEK